MKPGKAEPGMNREIQELQQKYGIAIKRVTDVNTRAKAAVEAMRAMEKFLGEWNPMGRRLMDLQEIIGPGIKIKEDVWLYKFDTGCGGWSWKFTCRDGVIVGMEKISLD
ncbi:MAG: hypothetical protein AB1696_18805 [Planctomycetota bacterium]